MNMKNSLQKRTPVQNLQMAVGTACAMGTATMLSTVMAYADVSTAIDKVFNVGNQVSNSIAKGLTNVVVPIGIAVFLYMLVRMLLASEPKDVQTYKTVSYTHLMRQWPLRALKPLNSAIRTATMVLKLRSMQVP